MSGYSQGRGLGVRTTPILLRELNAYGPRPTRHSTPEMGQLGMPLAYSLKGWLKPAPAQPQDGSDSEAQGSARPLLAANKTAQDELDGWLKAWVRSKAQRSQDTAISYAAANRDFLEEVAKWGLTKEAVEAYMDSLAGLSLSTQAHHISAVRGFVGFLALQGLCDRRLLDFLVRPRVPTSAMGSKLCETEARALLECARQEGLRVEATIHLALTTGLRAGELCRARFCDLRREAGSGEVVLYVVGKGTKSRWVAILPAVFRLLCALHNQEGVNAQCRKPLVMNHFGSGLHALWLGQDGPTTLCRCRA